MCLENKIKTLRASLNDQLNKNFLSGIAVNRPHHPMLIVYCGENAAKTDGLVFSSMRSVWKNKVDAICKIRYQNGSYLNFSDGAEVDKIAVGELVDTMQSTEGNFIDVNRTIIFQIHDSRDYNTLEDFKNSFKTARRLPEDIGMYSAILVSIVLLDESTRGMAFSNEIRTFFFNGLNGPDYEKDYSRTILLSNRLKNGILLANEREKENQSFIGNLLIVLNNKMDNGMLPLHTIFSNQNPICVTASHSVLNRPNKEICDVILNTMISWLDSNMGEGKEWSVTQLLDAMKINDRNFVEHYFGQNVEKFLPKSNLLEGLPRRNYMIPLHSLSYDQFERETYGSFSHFYKDYYETKLKNENASVLHTFETEFETFVQEKIPSDVALQTLKPANIDRILESIIIPEPNGQRPVMEYMKQKALYDFWQDAKEICEEKLRERQEQANKDHFLVQQIWTCFQNMSFGNDDLSTSGYYSDLAKRALSGYAGKSMTNALNQKDVTEDALLDAIREAIFEIFDQEAIFTYPLAEELVTRMGTNVDIEQMISSLVNNIQNKMHLKTALPPQEGLKFVMVNQQQNSKETLLYTHLKNHFKDQPNVRFLNTGDNNTIGLIQLYYCGSTSLLSSDSMF